MADVAHERNTRPAYDNTHAFLIGGRDSPCLADWSRNDLRLHLVFTFRIFHLLPPPPGSRPCRPTRRRPRHHRRRGRRPARYLRGFRRRWRSVDAPHARPPASHARRPRPDQRSCVLRPRARPNGARQSCARRGNQDDQDRSGLPAGLAHFFQTKKIPYASPACRVKTRYHEK